MWLYTITYLRIYSETVSVLLKVKFWTNFKFLVGLSCCCWLFFEDWEKLLTFQSFFSFDVSLLTFRQIISQQLPIEICRSHIQFNLSVLNVFVFNTLVQWIRFRAVRIRICVICFALSLVRNTTGSRFALSRRWCEWWWD